MRTKRKPTFRWANQKISTGSKCSENQRVKQTFCEKCAKYVGCPLPNEIGETEYRSCFSEYVEKGGLL